VRDGNVDPTRARRAPFPGEEPLVSVELVPKDPGCGPLTQEDVTPAGRALWLRSGPWLRGSLPALLQAAACLVAAVALNRADEEAIGEFGLLQALPATYWGCLAVIVAVFCYLLAEGRERPPSLVLSCLAFTVMLHGAPAILEREPRFPTAYIHAGMVDQIVRHGSLLQGVDARYSWGGFFAAAAVFVQATHLSDLSVLLRIAPVVAVSSYVPPTLYLARYFLGGWRRPWTAVAAVIGLNWVGQDYFAPQTFAFALYLYCLAAAVIGLRGMVSLPGSGSRRPCSGGACLSSPPGGRLVRLLKQARMAPVTDPCVGPSVRRGCVTVVCASVIATSMSHQLTPFVLTMDLLVLTGLGVLGNRYLLLFSILATLGWVNYGASAFWSGHWSLMFGNIGHLGSVVDSSVTARFQGDGTRLLILSVRTVLSAVVWSGAVVGLAVDARRERRPHWVLAGLFLVPFALLANQDYGGEGALRLLLFTLPFAVICMALAVREEALRAWPVLVPLSLLAMVGAAFFMVARYGNEDFERTRPSDRAAVEALNHVAEPGAQAVSLSAELSWRDHEMFRYQYGYVGEDVFASGDLRRIVDVFRPNPKGHYLIITVSQLTYAEEVVGIPASRLDASIRRLMASDDFHLEYRNQDSLVFSYQGAPR
jgi:hypothetical protein